MPSVEVREAVASDAKAIASLGERLAATEPYMVVTGFDPATGADTVTAAIEGASQTGSCILVAERGRTLAGMAILRRYPPPERHGIVQLDMGVDRGLRRRGMGHALVQQSLDWATASGVHRIQLAVVAENFAAISLYLKNGFEIEGTLRKAFWSAEGAHDIHVMARLLA